MQSLNEVLNSVAGAPQTRESEMLYAAMDKLPSSYEKTYIGFVADLLDQLQLLAKVTALLYGEVRDCSEEPLDSIIFERAITYTRYLGGREADWQSPNPETQQRNEALLELLEARKPGETLQHFTADQQRTVLARAYCLCNAQVHHWMEGLRLAGEGFFDS